MAYNSEYQSVSGFSPDQTGECEMFWELGNEQIRVTEEWYSPKIKDLTPSQTWAEIIGVIGKEKILRLNYQKVKVWIIEKALDRKTIEKIKKEFYITKACTGKNNTLVLKPNNSPKRAIFYIITGKQLIINPAQKVTIRMGEQDLY